MASVQATSDGNDIAIDFTYFRIYKDGRIDRLLGEETVPQSPDGDESGVRSKDVVLSPESGLSARIFLPKSADPTRKLPFLVYFHGGAFCAGNPFSVIYSGHVAALSAEANAVVLSVHYRRAPEHPLPIAYNDALEALKWASAHFNGSGPDTWVNEHADLVRLFVGGDSAGANIAHNAVMRAGLDGPDGPRIAGLLLVHPFFGNEEVDKLLEIIFPSSTGPGDPRVTPGHDPELGRLGCERVLVFVAEKDHLRDRGVSYYEALRNSGWAGSAEVVEEIGERHVFHLLDPKSEKAGALMKRAASFVNQA